MNNKLMLYFFFSFFSHFSAVTPARSYIFGLKTGGILCILFLICVDFSNTRKSPVRAIFFLNWEKIKNQLGKNIFPTGKF